MSRLPSRLLVDLLLRSAASQGGFAAILARGDAHGGAVLVQCRDRATEGPLLEQQFDGSWHPVGPAPGADAQSRADYLDRRRRIDPDLWLVELDIVDAPQFIALLNRTG